MASRVFAVDLGAWSVKVAVASPGLRGASLLNVVEKRVEQGPEPVEQRMKAALMQLVNELRLREDAGYIAVYGDQVFAQILDFGFKSLRRSELEKAVGNELENLLPVDLEDMVYTFEQLPPVPDHADGPVLPEAQRGRVAPPVEGMRVLSYAMQRERAEQLIALGKDSGFTVQGLLACGGGAIRLVERVPSLARARETGPVAVIDIGHDRTDVTIVQGNRAVFSRSVARAGRHVTQAIMSQWHLGFAEAEYAKHTDGFIGSAALPVQGTNAERIHTAMATELAPFSRDLRQTLVACRARTGFVPVAAIVVGGGGRLRGIAEYLGEQLGIPTWRPSPEDLAALAGPRLGEQVLAMAGGTGAADVPVDTAAMTIGAAFDAAGGRPSFNLRSGALAAKMDLSFLRAKAVPLGIAALSIAAFAAGAAYADLYRLRKSEKVLSTRLATESAEHYGTAKTAQEILKDETPVGGGGPGGSGSPMPKMSAYDILVELSAKIPPKEKISLDIDHLTIDRDKIFIQATTKTADEIDLLKNGLKFADCVKDSVPGAVTSGPRQSFTFTLGHSCM